MEYELTKQVQEESLTTLKKLIAYPSILDEKASDTPFGQDIQNCLKGTLEECEKLGLRTYIDPDGYYGYAEVGEGQELLAILCHLDVVPSGDREAWSNDPFELTIEGESLYGRGTQDDKGPTVAALYAVKALMNQGYTFNKRVRLVFGTDEENIWRCMDKYNEKEEAATYGFAPDADFPLTYAEKGLLQFYLEGPGTSEFVVNVDEPFNVVPDSAKYQGKHLDAIKKDLEDLNYDYTESGEGIVVKGKSVHSKDAQEGANAITRLAKVLNNHYTHPSLEFVSKYLNDQPTGAGIFGEVSDQMSGHLTVNISKLIINNKKTQIAIDMRIPVTADKDALINQLNYIAESYQLEYKEFDYLNSLYVPIESELVQSLLKVYRDLTGDMSEPISSGGATFARTMKNCVAFGARFDHVPATFHQVDENMPLSNYYQAMEIYAHAIKKLACD